MGLCTKHAGDALSRGVATLHEAHFNLRVVDMLPKSKCLLGGVVRTKLRLLGDPWTRQEAVFGWLSKLRSPSSLYGVEG